MNSEKKSLVSLGMSCQTVHQLRRLAASRESGHSPKVTAISGPFDWLICPAKSTIQLLNHRLPDFSANNIRIRKDRAYWQEFDLYLWHSFLVDNGERRVVDIDKTIEKELSRWRYLTHRFSTIDPIQTIFVLSNTQNNLESEVFNGEEHSQYHFTPALLEELHRSLADFFATTTGNIQLEVLTRKERMQDAEHCSYVTLLPVDQNEWKGSNQSWDQWCYQLSKVDSRQESTNH